MQIERHAIADSERSATSLPFPRGVVKALQVPTPFACRLSPCQSVILLR
jgi:hypothetical protein